MHLNDPRSLDETYDLASNFHVTIPFLSLNLFFMMLDFKFFLSFSLMFVSTFDV